MVRIVLPMLDHIIMNLLKLGIVRMMMILMTILMM